MPATVAARAATALAAAVAAAVAAIPVEQVMQAIEQSGPAAIAAAGLLTGGFALVHALWLALMGARRFALMGARRFAGRFAAVAMEESPESFQEPMATATATAAATTRRRGGRRVGLDDGRGRLIHAREPGRRYQQESSIHG